MKKLCNILIGLISLEIISTFIFCLVKPSAGILLHIALVIGLILFILPIWIDLLKNKEFILSSFIGKIHAGLFILVETAYVLIGNPILKAVAITLLFSIVPIYIILRCLDNKIMLPEKYRKTFNLTENILFIPILLGILVLSAILLIVTYYWIMIIFGVSL